MNRLSKILVLILILAVSAGMFGKFVLAADKNLFENASFEETQQPNQYGHLFKYWGGWLYEKPSRLALGTIAHSGRYSYEIICDQGGKARLLSPKITLEPGRYRVRYYMRGLSIGPGQWNIPLGFFVNYDGKNFNMKKNGTFGWTPVTYVFEIDKKTDNFMLGLALFAGGWLWIDDVSLTRVDNTVELTKEPVIGSEEAPITAPQSREKSTVRCTECGYMIDHDAENCYACGHKVEKRSKSVSAIKVIADFEDGKAGDFKGGTVVRNGSLQGNYVLSCNGSITLRQPQDWTPFDKFKFDVFNPSDAAAQIFVEIQDEQTSSYWTRVNYNTMVPPGRSTVTLDTDQYVGEKGRPGRPLLRGQIAKIYLDTKGNALLFDNFRLERLDSGSVLFEGLRAFDFGPLDSPVMPGFQQAAMATIYEPGRGFGWDHANLWKSFNALQPDALFQDFICPLSGGFRVDLPNGRYHVIMNIDSPGGYWGEVQSYKRRKVWANDAAVVDETMNMQDFIEKYFRNAQREDLPGVDAFNEYVQKMFTVREFDVTVSDGKLGLKFQGEGFAICLSSLVIYPKDKETEGERFWRWVNDQRRTQFNDYFKQVQPKATGAPRPKQDYVLFSRHFMTPVNPYDGPAGGEAIPPEGLSLTVAQGEEMPLTFSVQPSGDIGRLNVKIGSLSYVGGSSKPVPPITGAYLKPGWIDYRITRMTMAGSVYTVAPRYWHEGSAPDAPNVTRTFWLRTRIPPGVQPGPYKGAITVKPERGSSKSIPVTINVLPFALDPINDLAVGPWGIGMRMPWLYNDPDAEKWQWQMFDKSLDVLKDAGVTSFSGVPHIKVKAANGSIDLDTDLADREMALIKSKGFDQILSSYGAMISAYKMYGNNSGADADEAKKAGFGDVASFLKALYRKIDEHAVAHDWLPVAWNICDEPVEGQIKGAVANALAHREAVAGLKRTTVMGETSMTGKVAKDPRNDLVAALPITSLNLFDGDTLEILKSSGNRFSFYNSESRWTYGRYMKMLAARHNLMLRLSWHYNVVAGDPYYALDCREDDYAWYNTDSKQRMVPSLLFLGQILPGLNDYRYLSTLQRLVREKPRHAAAAAANRLLQKMMDLDVAKDRQGPGDVRQYDADRKAIAEAIAAFEPARP